MSGSEWPHENYDDLVKFYGQPGKNQVKLELPYPLTLSWNKQITVSEITVHEKVAYSQYRAMREILAIYGLEEIQRLKLNQWGGSLNVRKKRGSSNEFSTHAWGAANDWYPSGNPWKTAWEESAFSDPVYIGFFNAWIREGWKPLGLTWGLDAQHIQATHNGGLKLIRPNDKRFKRRESREIYT